MTNKGETLSQKYFHTKFFWKNTFTKNIPEKNIFAKNISEKNIFAKKISPKKYFQKNEKNMLRG